MSLPSRQSPHELPVDNAVPVCWLECVCVWASMCAGEWFDNRRKFPESSYLWVLLTGQGIHFLIRFRLCVYCSLYRRWLLISLLFERGKLPHLVSHDFCILRRWLAFCFWKGREAKLRLLRKIHFPNALHCITLHYIALHCISAPWNTPEKKTLPHLLPDFLLLNVCWGIETTCDVTKGPQTITRLVPTNPARCLMAFFFLLKTVNRGLNLAI